ncbi:MAG: DUF983 domain-containing protein [Rickettsiales bacterium]|jgi:uncharacterized protein (DUF983 family)|nr:DUF983 domain-containing protein [Rickettsiales bacterium]
MICCPRCGKGKLFSGLTTIVQQCSVCTLPLREHEQGDGPAFFGIVIVGALAAVGAAILDIKLQPPYWVHAAIWIPFIIIGSLACLRIGKAMLIQMQYRVKPWDFKE